MDGQYPDPDHALECDHREAIAVQLDTLQDRYEDPRLLLDVAAEIHARANGLEAIARRRIERAEREGGER